MVDLQNTIIHRQYINKIRNPYLNIIREEEEAKRAALIAKDHQLAIWTQAQIDRGLDPDAPPPPPDNQSSKPSAPKRKLTVDLQKMIKILSTN